MRNTIVKITIAIAYTRTYTHIYTHTHTHIHTHHTPFLKHTPPFLETVHGAAHTYMHIRTVMVVSSVILCVTHCMQYGEARRGTKRGHSQHAIHSWHIIVTYPLKNNNYTDTISREIIH